VTKVSESIIFQFENIFVIRLSVFTALI